MCCRPSHGEENVQVSYPFLSWSSTVPFEGNAQISRDKNADCSFFRYVDYAMHRVRLLRHHRIQAYVVFDGGHLPAKKGTELERRQKREENVARGHALAAQGRHLQAREFYAKCVDVTPQMAFQLIKVHTYIHTYI
jgi:5'-3' exonuclease